MKLSPATGDALSVKQGKDTFSATVIEVRKTGEIICKVMKSQPVVMTFRPDGHGHNGARLRPAKRVKGAV